ncbi:hypothetical protein [Streptomyces mangrovisoli]|uniref:Uncharacterized protein n=1 Tax=Streptomyces mangrovisoli TaxID=1428628 RepID=A0A1J4NQ80_9ACTN|nr:hypothetical protein [Streptomyces mangrovisoli]OIJ63413.1 hypothetical protein WN71_034175 [Streptomyces mangrovisoli]
MLSYLAATLPDNNPPSARLLALQCALRADATLHVRLPRGVLRSLRLDAPEPWCDLERANWLHIAAPRTTREITARLLDTALLGQAPARPDRRRAADWAMRVGRSPRTEGNGPLEQLAATYLAAYADPSGEGRKEHDQMARAIGLSTAQLMLLLDQLRASGLLTAWWSCPDSEDLYWMLRSADGPQAAGEAQGSRTS